ncbi:Protein PHYTOCHROME KINASE SUBSTRATE 4 [Linum grandiflorum]
MRAIPGKQLPPILDASFSSYIDSEISIFDARKYFNGGDTILNNKRLSVTNNARGAGAGLERISELPSRLSSASSSVDGYGYGNRNYRTRSFHATPTASSEASWNSQTGLLANPPGAMAVSVRHHHQIPVDDHKRIGSTAKNWLLRRRCPCSGKKSVQVQEKAAAETRIQRTGGANLNPNSRVMINAMMKRQGSAGNITPKSNFSSSPASIDWSEQRREEAEAPVVEVLLPNVVRRISAETTNRFVAAGPGLGQPRRVVLTPNKDSSNGGGGGGGFTFPILSQAAAAVPPPVKLVLNKPPLYQLEDPPRESLEVFRPAEEKVIISATTEGGRSSFTFPASPRSRMTATEDDIASDASSDLFEIESFSTQTTGNPLHRRDSMEDASTFNARRRLGGGGRVYGKSVEEEEELDEECYEPSEASIEWSVTTAEGFDRASVANYSEAGEEVRYTMMRNRIEEEESEKKNGKKRGSGGLLLSCRCEKAVSVGPPPQLNGGGGRAGAAVKKPPLPLGRSRSTARLSIPFPT